MHREERGLYILARNSRMPLRTLRSNMIIFFLSLFSTTEYTIGTKYTSYKYRTWPQNPIAKSNLMETCDMLVGGILFPNSQVQTVNVTLFAIGSASDFIPFAESYRKAIEIIGYKRASLQSRRGRGGGGLRFSLRLRTLHVNTRKRGTSREQGYRFPNLVSQYRLFSRSVKPLWYKLTQRSGEPVRT